MDQEEKFAANSIKFAPAGFAQKRSFANPNLGLSLSSMDFTDYSEGGRGSGGRPLWRHQSQADVQKQHFWNQIIRLFSA